ncbi:DNA-binding HxlR family transcriptional regulator [Duganella sp. SG902]|uniref:winged helix-turn-helix transcriptional regulator n=1 Tax=Duganella sp. SG902 TaxID=2587016 RepID=UPI00159CFE64|nr:helix-turn-helix domain-containing protein [Duganella sp. SG902]NVM78939.1 DNA-binding HxlR family transcriptional regulator [Duganella sp. SG902]
MDVTVPPATLQCRQVSEVFNRVGDKWSMQVIVALRAQPHRFNDLRRQVHGISQQMLTRTLKMLERDGLVERSVRATSPPQVDYALTPLGHSLAAPVRELAKWARANLDALHANQQRYDAGIEMGTEPRVNASVGG